MAPGFYVGVTGVGPTGGGAQWTEQCSYIGTEILAARQKVGLEADTGTTIEAIGA
jgi:hypothetical protein